jgi:hypothetical protein
MSLGRTTRDVGGTSGAETALSLEEGAAATAAKASPAAAAAATDAKAGSAEEEVVSMELSRETPH